MPPEKPTNSKASKVKSRFASHGHPATARQIIFSGVDMEFFLKLVSHLVQEGGHSIALDEDRCVWYRNR